jgi:hypothetical protein
MWAVSRPFFLLAETPIRHSGTLGIFGPYQDVSLSLERLSLGNY